MNNSLSRRSILTAGLAATSTVFAAGIASAQENEKAVTGQDCVDEGVQFKSWSTASDWNGGDSAGVLVVDGGRAGIAIDEIIDTIRYKDPHSGKKSHWEIATWTSPVHQIPFGASELVASWNVDTPAGTWLQVEMKGTYADGVDTPWYLMGRWASGESDITRTSVDKQGDRLSRIYTDVFAVNDPDTVRLASYRLRLTLHRRPGTALTPTVWRVGAMASHVPDRFEVPESLPGVACGIELPVPRYSQSIHAGQYPEYGGGGQAWCSPTSTQMVLEYFGRFLTDEELAWVDPAYADPSVCHAARFTYDSQYDGCGNWPFNTAYAAGFEGMEAVVTRLNNLSELEAMIAAGFPVITSQSFTKEELDGAGYGTAGHLMTIIGFTPDGDVIANDPASKDNDAVRHVYNRRQFENIWLRTKRKDANGNTSDSSGGICYLFKPTDQQWPELASLSR